jgi:hypothetical protein
MLGSDLRHRLFPTGILTLESSAENRQFAPSASESFNAKVLLWTLVVLVGFRLWLSVVLPMTGDEAYFIVWGEHPAGGYYDHPPMVGWLLAGLLEFSRAEWFLRLPVLILPLVIAACTWWIVRPYGVERARLATLLVLLQPANVWNVLITTDTPVILFSTLSLSAYVAALRARTARSALAWNALAGVMLGLGFLSKYFAALLGIAYVAHVAFVRRDAGRWSGLVLLLAASLPAPIYNLWWNSGHCWPNIMFNFLNRNVNAALSLTNPMLYVASLAYLLTPWLIVALVRQRQAVYAAIATRREASALFWLAVVPLALFALMSLGRTVGLHWIVSFIPLLAILAAIALAESTLARLVKWSMLFAALHIVVFVAVVLAPVQAWKHSKLYDGVVLTLRADKILEMLAPYRDDYLFAATGYSSGVTLAYHAQRPFAVFGPGSYHARQDDFDTDWRAQDGRNVLILFKGESAVRNPDEASEVKESARYFDRVEIKDFEIDGARFRIMLGQGFRYAAYRQEVLTSVRDRFYRIPAWLPQRGCEFCERYFP